MKFTINYLVAVASVASTVTEAMWTVHCLSNLIGNFDPIVNPGSISNHEHVIAGGGNFAKSVTGKEAHSAKCTSCTIEQDKSSYWTPTLFWAFKVNNEIKYKRISQSEQIIYYKTYDDEDGFLEPFPENFRMVAGDPMRTVYDPSNRVHNKIRYNCVDDGKMYHHFPKFDKEEPCNRLRVEILFPSCWNGKHDDVDYSKHMAYPIGGSEETGRCPKTHPHRLTHLFFETFYDVGHRPEGGELISSTGDISGYAHHGDFLNGWEPDTLKEATSTCQQYNQYYGRHKTHVFSADKCPAFTKTKPSVRSECIPVANGTEGQYHIYEQVLDSLPGGNLPFGTHPRGSGIFDMGGKPGRKGKILLPTTNITFHASTIDIKAVKFTAHVARVPGSKNDKKCQEVTVDSNESCFRSVDWAKRHGILDYPQFYTGSGLTSASSFADFQNYFSSLPPRKQQGCAYKACSKKGSHESKGEKDCQTASLESNEPCFRATTWAKEHGIKSFARLYTGTNLTTASTFADFQNYLNSLPPREQQGCNKRAC
eukprot:Pgem_evm1s8574